MLKGNLIIHVSITEERIFDHPIIRNTWATKDGMRNQSVDSVPDIHTGEIDFLGWALTEGL